MSNKFSYRLALSATLERHGDKEGTQSLYDYFGKKCIEYGLERAIKEKKLTRYKYYPVVVSLTDDEYSQIKNHPSIGAHILSNATIFKDIIPIVKYHHERYDGRGYPENLVGENIPLMARVTAVADTFEKDRENTLKLFLDVGFKIYKEETWKKFNKDVSGAIVRINTSSILPNISKIRSINDVFSFMENLSALMISVQMQIF